MYIHTLRHKIVQGLICVSVNATVGFENGPFRSYLRQQPDPCIVPLSRSNKREKIQVMPGTCSEDDKQVACTPKVMTVDSIELLTVTCTCRPSYVDCCRKKCIQREKLNTPIFQSITS